MTDGEARMPVTMTDEAREYLYSSGPESAKLPQALSEAFQLEALSVIITMKMAAKNDMIPSIDKGKALLVTRISPSNPLPIPVVLPPFVIYTNADDLLEMRRGNIYGFNALKTAQEYVRLYRQYYKDAL
jgi:hypothetical protein